MEERIFISPKPVHAQSAEINLPASKSVLNRQLLMAAMHGIVVQENLIDDQADDVRLMQKVIRQINEAGDSGSTAEIKCQNAATVFRMASVYAAYLGGDYYFTGAEALKKRPVGELAAGLADAGVRVSFPETAGYPPMHIRSTGLHKSHLVLKASESSQQISGFLIAGACIPGGLTLEITGHVVSEPYISLTLKLMQEAGARLYRDENRFRVEETGYPALHLRKEADWSSAAFFYAGLSLLPPGSSLVLKDLQINSSQADEEAAELFGLLGIHTEMVGHGVLITRHSNSQTDFNADFTHCPDLFNAFATAAALRQIPCTLSGLRHLRFKESDRLMNFLGGLDQLGYRYTLDEDILKLTGEYQKASNIPILSSSKDHRMAMSFALSGLRHPVILDNPYVVSKSFPGFYQEFSKLADIGTV